MLGLILTLSWLLPLPLWAGEPGTPHEPYWPQWRGPPGTGVAPNADLPVEWSEAKNIQWKRTLPGLGHSTPIIWGDRIFLTTAVPYGESLEPIHDNAPGSHSNLPVTRKRHFVVLVIRRSNGEILWQRTVHSEFPHEGEHCTGSLASASPVTNGERLVAFFGSRGIYCLDLDGKLQWKKDLGSMRTKHGHGEGSSPVLHDETLVINWDHEGQSFVSGIVLREPGAQMRLSSALRSGPG